MRYVEPFPLDMVHNYFLSKNDTIKTSEDHLIRIEILPKSRKHLILTFRMQCKCDHGSQTNQAFSHTNCNLKKIMFNTLLIKLTYAVTYCSVASLSEIFSNAFISNLAASRYFSTFLMTFRAMV